MLPWDTDGSRIFERTAHQVAGVHLLNAGVQHADGSIRRQWVSVTVDDDYTELDAPELRRLAAALLDEADVLDGPR